MELTAEALGDRLKGWANKCDKWRFYDQEGEPAAGNTLDIEIETKDFDGNANDITFESATYTATADFSPKHARLLKNDNTYVKDVNSSDFTFSDIEDGKKYKFTQVIDAGSSGAECTPEGGTGMIEEVA